MKSILQVFFYSILSGLLLSVAIPNEIFLTGCPAIAFIAIVPFYKAIKQCKSYSQAWHCGFIQTITTHLISSYWLAFFKDFAIFTLGGSALATAIIGGLSGVFMYMPFSSNYKNPLGSYKKQKRFYEDTNFKILYFTSAYVVYEFIKSSGFLGYPWGTVSSTMYNFPIFMQNASITGTYGITFVTVLFNCILLEIIDNKNLRIINIPKIKTLIITSEIRQTIYLFCGLFILALLYGTYEYKKTRNPIKQITTILVQQNEDPWLPPDDERIISSAQDLTIQAAREMKEQSKELQLVVWSEGNLQYPYRKNSSYYYHTPYELPLIPFIQDINAPFLIGGSMEEKVQVDKDTIRTKFYNSALFFNKFGEMEGYYAKLHLVPFAELIPGMDNPIIYNFLKKVAKISAGWAKGEQLTYFDIPCTPLYKEKPLVKNVTISHTPLAENTVDQNDLCYVKVATPICFDDAFTDTMRPLYNNGAELFINITDDSWSLKKSSEYQHFVIASYRSIEYRTTLVRSTNAGVTVILDPAGKVLASLPLFQSATLNYDIPVYKRQMTTYAVFGNWLCWLCVLFLFGSSILKSKISQE